MNVVDVHPSAALQGLDLFFQVGASARLHAFVDAGGLEQTFMSGPAHSAWLAAYRDNATTIETLIARKHAANPGQPVLISLADFGAVRQLRSSGLPT